MARCGGHLYYVVASAGAPHGARFIGGYDLPTRTVTRDGTTYRCEWSAHAGAVALTKVGKPRAKR